MPRRESPAIRMECLTRAERTALRDGCQAHWYRLVGARAQGATVLDVGAGTGYGLDVLLTCGVGLAQGIDPLPLREDVLDTPIKTVPDRSWDWVLAIDVIEHVEDDIAFLRHLLRVARHAVFMSTPNWAYSRGVNPYHVREYTASELDALTRGIPSEIWVSGEECIPEARTGFEPGEHAANFGIFLYPPG